MQMLRSVQWSRRCPVHELPDRISDAPPDRRAVVIALFSKLLGSLDAFHFRLIAIVLEHQIGDAPDVDFRDHVGRLANEPVFTVNTSVCGPRDDFRLPQRPPRRLCRPVARGAS
jgi:hypothetical protein